MQSHELDYVLCECALEALEAFVSDMEEPFPPRILSPPKLCLVMIPAEDTVEKQPFYLGEALMTQCEVEIGGKAGYGMCLGDQPLRAYCIAVVDALHQLGPSGPEGDIQEFVASQSPDIEKKWEEERSHILKSRVDFKLMDEA